MPICLTVKLPMPHSSRSHTNNYFKKCMCWSCTVKEYKHICKRNETDNLLLQFSFFFQIAYILFLIIFSYTVLVKMRNTPTWQECLAILYICTLGCEKVRELLSSEPVAISHKFAVWIWNMWNPCDAAAVLFFFIALAFRLQHNTMEIGRIMYCINSVYWYLRILNILGVNKYLGK